MVKNLPVNAGDEGSASESGRSPGGGDPVLLVLHPVLLPGESRGQRSLAESMGSQRIEHK